MRVFPSKARTAARGPDVSMSTEARAAGSAILAESESGGARKASLRIHGIGEAWNLLRGRIA
jgi:hypothetical protein